MKIAYRSLILLVALLVLAFNFMAAPVPAYAEDEIIDITDAGLRSAILDNLGKGPSDNITRLELESITSLDAANCNIASITDIQYCINLVELDISKNVLQNLSGIAACTKLEVLKAFENQLTDISAIQSLTSLRVLYLYMNQIPGMAALTNLTNLEDIMLCMNPFNDISPLSGHTNLYRVWFNYTQVADISYLAGLNNLQTLYISHNQISDIGVLEFLPALDKLDLSYNLIAGITPLVSNTGITGAGDTVVINNNLLDTGSGSDDMDDIDALLGRGVNLTYLPQDYVPPVSTYTLTVTVDPVGAGTVTINPDKSAYESGDNVTLDPQPASGYVFSNWSGDLSGSDNPAGVTMDCDKNVIAHFVIDPAPGEVVNIPDANLEGIIRAAIQKPGGDILKTDMESITALDGVMKGIVSISGLEYCTYLQTLMLCFNDISDISPLTNLTNLNVLWITSNPHLSEITPISGLTNLSVLKLSGNNISDISALTANTGLTGPGDWVILIGNPLDLDAGSDDMLKIEELQARGIHVYYALTQYTVNVTIEPPGAGVVTQADSTISCDLIPSLKLTAVPSSGWVFSSWSGGVSGNVSPVTIALYDNTNVTAIFTAVPADDDSTGGTGGGYFGGYTGSGGGSATPNKRVTGLLGLILDNGLVLNDIEAFSVDEWVKLLLPANISAHNSAGALLHLIVIEKLDPVPPGISIESLIGGIYSFSPDGAAFTPPAVLTFRYDPLLLPPGAREENIKIVWWDEDAGEWVELDSVVDTDKKIVTAYIGHFSIYSLAVNIVPATMEVTNVSLAPEVVEKGAAALVKVTVTNTGDLPGNFLAVLNVNGEEYQKKMTTITSGGSAELAFSMLFENSGIYNLSVNGIDRILTVKPSPAFFSMNGLSITPTACEAGEAVQIKFVVVNSGETAGDYTVNCLLDGKLHESRQVRVGGDASQEVAFTLTSQMAGMHEIAINEVLDGSFEVKTVQVPAAAAVVPPAETAVPPASAADTVQTAETTAGASLGKIPLAVAGILLVIVALSIMVITRMKKKQV
jgi:internalin A